MSKQETPKPVNRMILVEVIKEQKEEQAGILVPKGYKEINPHSTARVVSVSPGCTIDVREGSEIVFETSVLEEVKTKGSRYTASFQKTMFSAYCSIMIFFIINLMIFSSTAFYEPEHCAAADIYGLIHDEAMQSCVNASSSQEKSLIIDQIIEIEKKYNLPDSMKGLALAAACQESRFNPKARGDRKFSKYNRPKAIGLYQMWPWWESNKYGYGINREDVQQSTDAFIRHIVRQIPKVKKNCRYKSEERIWIAAWVHAIRAPKKGGRCYQRPKHLRVLHRWQRNIKKLCKDGGC